jgi:hypothetical protein
LKKIQGSLSVLRKKDWLPQSCTSSSYSLFPRLFTGLYIHTLSVLYCTNNFSIFFFVHKQFVFFLHLHSRPFKENNTALPAHWVVEYHRQKVQSLKKTFNLYEFRRAELKSILRAKKSFDKPKLSRFKFSRPFLVTRSELCAQSP